VRRKIAARLRGIEIGPEHTNRLSKKGIMERKKQTVNIQAHGTREDKRFQAAESQRW